MTNDVRPAEYWQAERALIHAELNKAGALNCDNIMLRIEDLACRAEKAEADLAEARREMRQHVQQRISTRCPSCGHQSLFIGLGGHLTCSWLDCKDPGIERAIEKLKASPPAPSGWQPIETAPKDRTRIILYQPDGMWRGRGRHRGAAITVGYWHQPANPEAAGFWVGCGAFRPTHWMPLPPAPTQEHTS